MSLKEIIRKVVNPTKEELEEKLEKTKLHRQIAEEKAMISKAKQKQQKNSVNLFSFSGQREKSAKLFG